MKPHPGIRKTMKWGGTTLTVLLAVVWVGSGWRGASYESGAGTLYGKVAIGAGVFHGSYFHYKEPQSLSSECRSIPLPGVWQWSFGMNPQSSDFWQYKDITVPLWGPSLLALLPTMIAWRLDTLARRRARLNLCPTCRYDRTGLASKDAVCPECGAAAPSPRSAA